MDDSPAAESQQTKMQGESEKLENDISEKPSQSFECDMCSASFEENKHLIEHSKAHLDESRMTSEETADPAPKYFECDICYLSFPNQEKLQDHKKIHQDEDINEKPKIFECEICFLSFTEKKQLTEHLKYHARETKQKKGPSKKVKKTVYCKICDKSFPGKKQLAKHSKIHVVEKEADGKNEKNFNCKTCSLSFLDKKSLKRHKKSHKKHHSNNQSSVKKAEKSFSCDICDMSFKSKKGKTTHMKVHMEENVNINEKTEQVADNFQCEICGLSFRSKKFLTEHKKAHPKEYRIKKKKKQPEVEEISDYCKLCQITFTDRDELTRHLKVHLEESIAMNRAQCLDDKVPTLKYCKICNVPFTDRRFLVEHMKTHLAERTPDNKLTESVTSVNGNSASLTNKESLIAHPNKLSGILANAETVDKDENPKSFECEICGASFTEIQELGDHLKVHVKSSKEGGSGNIPNTCFCEICNIPFSDYTFLAEHLKLHLAEESVLKENKLVDERPKIFEFVCQICNAGFSKKNNLTKHLKIHLKEKPYKCDVCDIQCTTKSNMTSHMMIHTGEKPYKCTICDAAFSKRCNLVKHHSIHTGEKPFKCYFCEAGFSSRSNMVAHMRLHTGEKPFKCDKCDATFLLESKLIKHQRVHTGERPFKCDVCGAAFIHKTSLNKHMKQQIHNGEHPFKCEYCDLELTSQVRLTNHLRTHTEEKKYKCDSCHAEFAMKCTLTIHQKIHTGEKPFKCDACDAAFSQRGSLTVHQRIHAGDMPFKCHICDAAYFQRGSLAVHMKLHANMSENYSDDPNFQQFHKRILDEIGMTSTEGDGLVKTGLVDGSKALDNTADQGINLSNAEKTRNGGSKEVKEHNMLEVVNRMRLDKMSGDKEEISKERIVEDLLRAANCTDKTKHSNVTAGNQGFDTDVNQHTSYKRRKFEKIIKNYFDENLEYGRHQTNMKDSVRADTTDQELNKVNQGGRNELGNEYTKKLLQKSGLSREINNIENFNKHQIDSTVDGGLQFKRGVTGPSFPETSDNQVLNMHKDVTFNFDPRFDITPPQKLDSEEARKSNIEKYPTWANEDRFYNAEHQLDYRKIFGNMGYQNGELLDSSKLLSKKNTALSYAEGFYRPENQNLDFYKAVRMPGNTTGYDGSIVTSQYQDVNLGHMQKTATSDCSNVGVDARYNTSLDRNSGFLDSRKLTLENTWAMGYADKSGYIPHGSLYFDNVQRYNRSNPYENMSLNPYTVNQSEEKLQRPDKNSSDLIQAGTRLDTPRSSGDQSYLDQYACGNPYGYPMYK